MLKVSKFTITSLFMFVSTVPLSGCDGIFPPIPGETDSGTDGSNDSGDSEGTDTSDDSSGDPGPQWCDETRTVVKTLKQELPNGWTAEEILRHAGSKISFTVDKDLDHEKADVSPNSDGVAGWLSTTFDEYTMVYVKSDPKKTPDGSKVKAVCMDRFFVSGDLEIHTEDGALQDRLASDFVFDDPRDPDFETGPSFEQKGGIHGIRTWRLLKPDELKGSFRLAIAPEFKDKLTVDDASYAGLSLVLYNGKISEGLFRATWFLNDQQGDPAGRVQRMFNFLR